MTPARARIIRHAGRYSTLAALIAASVPATAPATAYTADVVVVGGSFGAPAAALAASRANPSGTVLLIEPTDWLGGQATSQGVAAIDNSFTDPGRTLMLNDQNTYYPKDYKGFLSALTTATASGAPGLGLAPNGTGWVSRECFDPRTGAWVLDQMVAARPNITVLKMTVVKNVTTASANDAFGTASKITGLNLIQRTATGGYVPFTKLTSVELPDWFSATNSADFTKQTHTVTAANLTKGMVVIDGSETGDATVLSGAAYTIGREVTTEKMTEAGAIPAHNETQAFATVFPFCVSGGSPADNDAVIQSPWADFSTYYAQRASDFFSLGSQTWQGVFTYRRLYRNGPNSGTQGVNTGDVSMQNWNPGNDYPFGSIYLDKAAAAATAADWQGGLNLPNFAGAEKHATAWYFWYRANKPGAVTFTPRLIRGTSDALAMFQTGHGLSKFPYIRENRRLIGLENFRLTQRYFKLASTAPGNVTSFRYYDSVGIGSYVCDVRPQLGSTGVGISITSLAPFYIPYRALASSNVRNLMAGGKNAAYTWGTNAAYRLHPIEWSGGSAAGAAAGLMARDGKTNIEMLDIPRLRELQNLVASNGPISWPTYDTGGPIPPQNGELVCNDFAAITAGVPFQAEVYHFRAVRARVYALPSNTLLGETTTRANGRLRLDGAVAPAGTTDYAAYCYDGGGTLLDVLSASGTPVAPPSNDTIVDDADPSPAFITAGSWTVGTAQANKYATTYRYVTGGTGTRTATFALNLPQSGNYDIFTWYPESSNRATDSPFTVKFNGGASQTTVRINQQINGGQWVLLGRYAFNGGTNAECVVLSDNTIADATKLVMADAVKATRVPGAEVKDWSLY